MIRTVTRVRAALAALVLLAAAGHGRPAAAFDFSGAYAGVNAGWAKTAGRDGPRIDPDGEARDAQAAPALPPSAAKAAQRMRGSAAKTEPSTR